MRFNCTATLVKVLVERDKYGASYETSEEREVFCNRFTLSASNVIASQSVGLQARAIIQLRSIDYEGEQRVIFDGETYEVSNVSDSGEFVKLTLAKELKNAQ